MPTHPIPEPLVLRVLSAIAGGELRGEQDGGRLVLRHAPRNGCAAMFLIPWSIGWTAFLVFMARDVAARPDPNGIFWLTVMAILGLAGWASVTSLRLHAGLSARRGWGCG